MQEIHGAKYGDRAQNSMPTPGKPLSPDLHVFTNLEALQTSMFRDFYGAFLTQT